jgi:O-antigen/teichoic acid export membrane protein
VNNSEDLTKPISGKTVAKNTIYNLLGYGLPLLVAIVLIPPLIKGLGEERFGILSLSWVVIGYFSFFDLGIGRALTKLIAEKIGVNSTEEIPGIFWTSFFLMLIASFSGTIILLFVSDLFIQDIFKISESLKEETLHTFYVLAFSIPIVATTAGLRGILEAYQKFGAINTIRIFLGVFTFLGPLLCLIFTQSLFWIVLFLVAIRIIVWILYLLLCFKVNPEIKLNFKFERGLVKPVLKISGWMTVSNIVGPIIIYLDRFLIGAVISAAAITYYTTPYEVVTKLFIIPGALVAVLFPVFSSSFQNNPDFSKKIFLRGTKFIFIFIYPVILLILTFAFEGMDLWLGRKFAEESSLVLQLLAVGVLLNSLAYLPFTYLQGVGRPDIPAKINLIELPFYVLAMWLATKQFGISGSAFVWAALSFVNTLIQFFIVFRLAQNKFKYEFRTVAPAFMICLLIVPFMITGLYLKIVFAAVILFSFALITRKHLLLKEEKTFLVSRFKMFTV